MAVKLILTLIIDEPVFPPLICPVPNPTLEAKDLLVKKR